MLPTLVSREVEAGIQSFLRTTFPSSTPSFEGVLGAFLGRPGQVFKGPYYGLRLPFRPAPPGPLPFRHVRFPYRPHLHQARAFGRLCGDAPRSTLVATGTGSGKTECFLYPILEHCAAEAGTRGIKAILIYPMNALATDQGKRLAAVIHGDPALRGKVRAGLFIGGETEESSVMTPQTLVTRREAMRDEPPDILVTNYKMLDYLLLRPGEQDLWQHNGPGTLRFLVVDELHTFDGAQATDLACLVRRLKARLRTPEGHLCSVGTSATLGAAGAAEPLLRFASMVFAEPFGADGVIEESLLSLGDVVEGCLIRHHGVPTAQGLSVAPWNAGQDPEAYLADQYRLWFDVEPPASLGSDAARCDLGDRLREHSFFRNLLTLAERSGQRVVAEEWLLHEVGQMLPSTAGPDAVRAVIDGFLALCAHSRHRAPGTGTADGPGHAVPLLRVHVHLWTRELTRLVASVGKAPAMAFSADLQAEALRRHLPVLHCRECGLMGWGGTMRANADRVSPNLDEFYRAFFGRLPTLRMLFPVSGPDGGGLGTLEGTHAVCGRCLGIHGAGTAQCASCGDAGELVPVLLLDRTRRGEDDVHADRACPGCESASGLTILGSRAASLTSVALGQLYASPFNREKKALAFSDNVQDASHRSGFFAARTFRVNLRTAIRKVLDAAGGPMTLAAIESRFMEHWRGVLGEVNFIGTFLAPNMEWLEDYEVLKREGRLPTGSRLGTLVARRLGWEITAEFGFNSRIGRTLEKSGAGVAHVDGDTIAALPGRMGERLREHAGGFATVGETELSRVLTGLVHRLRTLGGIFHPELEGYVGRGGDTYLLNQQHHMPTFGRLSRSPSFFHQGHGRFQRFERLVAGGTSQSWAQRWVAKCLGSLPGLPPEASGLVLEGAMRILQDAGIVEERAVQGDRVWGMTGDRLWLTTEVRALTCQGCGHPVSCAPHEVASWDGAPCLRPSCHGVQRPGPAITDYYGDRYRSGDVIRIRSAEHTGMLDRKARERVETRFMAHPPARRATDPNLLSCTPTLEMGVNIGDLSSVILCTVPPATANYVQRVGRAGRKEGAAVSLAIAAAKAHDLYYFERPEDMMTGEIRPPGTFLNAPAVLERQFTAFCFDRWSEQANPRPILPPRIDTVLETVRAADSSGGFPYDYFRFVEAQLGGLIESFLGLFGADELSPESRVALENFARGGDGQEPGVTQKVLRELTRLMEERADLRDRMKRVGRAIERNRAAKARDDTHEAELEELLQTRDGLQDILGKLGSQPTLEVLTDAGLLPNYAFPEEGVALRGIILRRNERPDPEKGRYKALTLDYVRPAAAGILELAPGSLFYVDGRRLRIDQVTLNEGTLQRWHFCDACTHMERVDGSDAIHRRECPACGSPNWADASLRRDLVKLRQVVSTMVDRTSRSHDEAEEREFTFFNRHESVVIPEGIERVAYQVLGASVPFGFEFLGKLTLRVVNLGEENPRATAFRLGGRDVTSAGFSLCPSCGKVQGVESGNGDAPLKHDVSCRQRGREGAPLKAVFLYRELTSEAIRVLLPSSSAEEDGDMTSFVAALHLGLRLYFEGSIDHLRSCVDQQAVEGTPLRRKYLVLYDQVPGGTGYLKQLSKTPDVLLEVLRRALRHLQDCPCASRHDHEADGCHRCILQARNRRDHAHLSRTTAIRLLDTILQASDRLERVSKVSDIDIHPLIQSELEKAFLQSLRAVPGARLDDKTVRGRTGFLWRRDTLAWEVEPQVKTGADDDVGVPSIPDFVLYPIRPDHGRPIAVFLDGFRYHADESAGNNRVSKDVKQRQALVHSGRYWVWSFSWEDIQFRNDPTRILATGLGEAFASRRGDMARQILVGDDLAWVQTAGSSSSWALFLDFLASSASPRWERLAYLYVLALAEIPRPVALARAANTIADLVHAPAIHPSMPTEGPHDGLGSVARAEQMSGVVVATHAGLRERLGSGVFVALRFNDDTGLGEPEFPRHWRGFLRLLNRVQFLPNVHVLTTRGAMAGEAAAVCEAFGEFVGTGGAKVQPSVATSSTVDSAPPEIALVAVVILPVLRQLAASGRPWPIVSYELEADGRIIGTAEVAWPGQRVALIHEGARPDSHAFRSAGWTVLEYASTGETAEMASRLIRLLPEFP